jgi:hypothetical protein
MEEKYVEYLRKTADKEAVEGYMKIQYPNGIRNLTKENDNYIKWLKKEKQKAKHPDYVSEDITFEMLIYEKIQY